MNQFRNDSDEELEIDLLELYHELLSNAKKIGKVTGICVLVAGAYLCVASPTYESEALLRVKQPRGIGSSLLESIPGTNTMATKQLMSTYAEILKSRSVLEPVIKKTQEPNKEGKYPAYDGFVKTRINTEPFKDTEIMKVTVTDKTPEGAKKLNDALIATFLQRLTGLSRDEQSRTRAFLEDRIKGAKKELDNAETKLTEYRRENKLIGPTEEMKLASERFGMVDKLIAENKVNLAAANARLEASEGIIKGDASKLSDNKVLSGLYSQLAKLEAERIGYADKYTEKHPKMIQLAQEIGNLRAKINDEVEQVVNLQAPTDNQVQQKLMADRFASKAEAQVAASNLESLAELNEEFKETIGRLSEREQAYIGIERNVKVANEVYVMLAKRVEEAKVAEAGVANEVQIVDVGTLPEKPIAPKKAKTLAIAAVLGFLLSAGYVVIHALMNRTVKTSEDVEKYLGLPVLGQIPDYDSMQKHMDASKDDKPKSIFDKIRSFVW